MTTGEPKTVKARIADLNVLMHCKTQFMVRRLRKYAAAYDGPAQVEIDISEAEIEAYCARYPSIDRDNAEYMLSGACFYNSLYRKYQGILLHASALSMDREGYLFSANSGTGKSTHAQIWACCFGERVRFINDDKPALRKMKDGWFVYGTPWSGKTEINDNICVPVKAIAFLYRSRENKIERLESVKSLPYLYEQTIRPKTETGADKVLDLLDDLIGKVPIYHLGCNMELSAAEFAYHEMRK